MAVNVKRIFIYPVLVGFTAYQHSTGHIVPAIQPLRITGMEHI